MLFRSSQALVESALKAGINVRQTSFGISVAFDERSDDVIVETLAKAWALTLEKDSVYGGVPHLRSTSYLSHPIFNSYHSETAMLRYLRSLSDRDLALDRTMIPLGSCTMKLNSTTEMEAITWPEFADLHPFAPVHQSAGTRRLIKEQIGRAHV